MYTRMAWRRRMELWRSVDRLLDRQRHAIQGGDQRRRQRQPERYLAWYDKYVKGNASGTSDVTRRDEHGS
jgi:hypothetical protein